MKYEKPFRQRILENSRKASPAEVNEAVKNEIFLNKYA